MEKNPDETAKPPPYERETADRSRGRGQNGDVAGFRGTVPAIKPPGAIGAGAGAARDDCGQRPSARNPHSRLPGIGRRPAERAGV